MKSQCSQNLSFLISGFFPNYFQINFQLIHKDEIWCVTYNPKHVVILLPISWFHGGLNKLHMWHAVFLCINGPGNPWHCPALPHSADEQWQHQGLIKFWVIFFPCLIQGEKDSQAPSSVTVLTVWDFVCLPLVGASPQKVNKVNAVFPNPCDGSAHAAQLKQLTKGARATKFPELCQKDSHRRASPGVTLEERAGSGLREEQLRVIIKRSAYSIISNQKAEEIWHLSSQDRTESSMQRWTVYWSKCIPGHTCLTPRPGTSMGMFLPASVGCLDCIWWAWHISGCWKKVWFHAVEMAVRSHCCSPSES